MSVDDATDTQKPAITNSEKILLLLLDFHRYENEYRVPEEISQNGISRIIGIERCNVARELIKLKKKDLVFEKLVHFKGIKRRKKGYFLTPNGFNLASKIRNYVKDIKVTIRKDDGSGSDVVISNVNKHLGSEMFLAEIISNISYNGVFEIAKTRKEQEDILPIEKPQLSRFVGRKMELKQIMVSYRNASNGRGTLLLISGEAGIGKTRLVNEIRKKLAQEDIDFLQGSCLYQTAVDPYLPFVEALGNYLREADKTISDPAMKDIVSTAPEFLGLMPLDRFEKMDTAPLTEKDINLNRERMRIFETVNKVLKNISEKKVVVLFIDDIQWADVGSIHLLHYLARDLKNSSILLIGAYRPEELGDVNGKPHPLKETISRLNRENIVEEIELDRLGLTESKSIVKSFLKDEIIITDELISLIHKETDGNPFFIEEILNSLSKGDINKLPTKIEIPKTIRDTITRRIEMLDPIQRKILGVSSVIGEKFALDVLINVINENEAEVLDNIDSLQRARLIEEDSSGDVDSYRFHHCKIREVAYDMLNIPRKRKLHERIGEILEELYKDDIDYIINELAYHYTNTKQYHKVYEYSWMAGEKASDIYSFDEALTHYKNALEATERLSKNFYPGREDNDKKSMIEIDEELYEQEFKSLMLKGEVDLSHKKIEIINRLGRTYDILGKWDQSIEYYDNALNLLLDKYKKAEIVAKLGDIYRKKGMFDNAMKLCENALKVIDGECREKCLLLNCIGGICYRRGDLDEALIQYKESLGIAEKICDEKAMANIFNNMGIIYFDKCEYDKALGYHKENLAIREKIGDQIGIAQSYQNIGNLYTRIGRFQDAIRLFEKCFEIRKEIGDQVGAGDAYYNIGIVHFGLENYDEALEFFEKSLKVKQKMGDLLKMAIIWGGIGLAYYDKGDYDKAEEYLEKSVENCRAIGDKLTLSYNLGGLALCALKKDLDVDKAIELSKQALGLSREVGLRTVEAWNQQILGMIYRKMKNWDLAKKRFEEGIRINKEIEEPISQGEIYFEYALMWKDKGDVKKAKKNLELALAIFKEKSLEKKVERVKRELDEIGKMILKAC